MPACAVYPLGSAALLAVLAGGVRVVVGPADAGAVWLAAGVAYGVQLLAFAALTAGRRRESGFMIGWGLGMLMRFGALAGMAVLVTASEAFDPATALLCLIGFMMALVLIEPLFLRWAD